jgi:hypothetical protein
MRPGDSRVIGGDEAGVDIDFDIDFDEAPASATWGERVLTALLGGAVRLWCLPFLLVVWALTWTSIGLIRGAAALAGAGPMLLGDSASAWPGPAARSQSGSVARW